MTDLNRINAAINLAMTLKPGFSVGYPRIQFSPISSHQPLPSVATATVRKIHHSGVSQETPDGTLSIHWFDILTPF